MDPETAELRELVEKNVAIAEDTNRLVRGIQRRARWGILFQIIWWLTILGISGATYYYYLQPYVQKVQDAYGQVQTGTQQAKEWENQFAEFFKKFVPQYSAEASSTPQ